MCILDLFQITGFKEPPRFDGINFAQWRREVELWSGLTKLEKKQQGVAVALSLKDTARSVATALGEATLATDEGLKAVLDSGLWLQEINRILHSLVSMQVL